MSPTDRPEAGQSQELQLGLSHRWQGSNPCAIYHLLPLRRKPELEEEPGLLIICLFFFFLSIVIVLPVDAAHLGIAKKGEYPIWSLMLIYRQIWTIHYLAVASFRSLSYKLHTLLSRKFPVWHLWHWHRQNNWQSQHSLCYQSFMSSHASNFPWSSLNSVDSEIWSQKIKSMN